MFLKLKIFRVIKIAIAFLSLFNLSSVSGLKAEEILRIGAIPDQNPEHLNRLYKVLSSELSEQLNVQVRYKPVTNYACLLYTSDAADE